MALTAGTRAQVAVVGGATNDYQPAVLREANGALVVVFERLDGSLSGDLWITRSTDDGDTWSTPVAIVATSANERHAALVEDGAGGLVLFHLSGTGAASSFRLHRAVAAAGSDTFVPQGALALGWASGGEINPHVIRHADGSLTLTYHRLGGASYVARSFDGGATWDDLRTPITTGTSQLPRIAFRESDQRWFATWQVGSSALAIFARSTTDVSDWSAPAATIADNGNHHDSLPVVMPDDAFVVFWARANGGQFDLASRRSRDGVDWEAAATQATGSESDIQPHPLTGRSRDLVDVYWGRERVAGSSEFDIVRERAVSVTGRVFGDSFEE